MSFPKLIVFSIDHYLDVQFRLLREDFVRPLREGIAQSFQSGMYNKLYCLFISMLFCLKFQIVAFGDFLIPFMVLFGG